MFSPKMLGAAWATTLAALLLTTSCATTDAADSGTRPAAKAGAADYTQMSPAALAEYLIYDAKGYKLDYKVQEGGEGKGRMDQDALQKVCSATKNKPSPEQAMEIQAAAKASIKYPEGGIKLGNWKKGRELAWSGFGYRAGNTTSPDDDHAKGPLGGNCYNCHQLANDRVGGTIGPNLFNYGKLRGNNAAQQRYVYEVIYNAHTYFPCTRMPRIGANGVVSQEAIADIMAYLFDPESPVNK